jgi:hypothetical protein
VYRDGSRDIQVLTTTVDGTHFEVDVIHTECQSCGAGVKHEEGCTYCIAECGWSACSV